MILLEIFIIILSIIYTINSFKIIKTSFNTKLRPLYGNIEEKVFNKNQLEFMHKDECS